MFQHLRWLWLSVVVVGCLDFDPSHYFSIDAGFDAGVVEIPVTDAGMNACDGVSCRLPNASMCTSGEVLVFNPVGVCGEGGRCQYSVTRVPCDGGCTADGGCNGEPCLGVACVTAPKNECADESSVRAFEPLGVCSTGSCAYASRIVKCAGPCVNGVCTPDRCTGVSCLTPPASSCSSAMTLKVHSAQGNCTDGVCGYAFTETTCTNGCSNGACQGDACQGVTCNTPPAATCASATTLRTFSSMGTCASGSCSYAPAESTCANGCVNGACAGDPCQGVSCNTPPAPSCSNATTLRTFTPSGTCAGGSCSYVPSETTCASGCVNGACAGDPCQGVTCSSPPAATCANSTTLRTFAPTGTCAGGTCSYAPNESTCASGCVNGACAGDPCQGVTCATPPAATCVNATTLRTFGGGTCSGGSCTYGPSESTCANGCVNGACAGDPCQGVRCTTPPAATCVSATTRRSFASMGTCAGGTCSYAPSESTCANGCTNGSCLGDPCQGVSCVMPPAPTCVSGTTLRTFSPMGSCAGGSCTYAPMEQTCTLGCSNGRCTMPMGGGSAGGGTAGGSAGGGSAGGSAVDPCSSATTCLSCTGMSACGWCSNGACRTGNGAGSDNGQCSDALGNWAWTSPECGGAGGGSAGGGSAGGGSAGGGSAGGMAGGSAGGSPVLNGETCAQALPLTFVGNVATATGNTTNFVNNRDDSCGSTAPDVFYSFTLTQPQSVEVTVATGGTTWFPAVTILSGCGSTVSLCGTDAFTVRTGARTLPAGTYTIVIDGRVSSYSGAYTLTARIAAPLSTQGDTCQTATPLTFSGNVATATGNTFGFLNDRDDACGSAGSDVYYSFTLTQPQSVEISVATGSASWYVATSLLSGCGSEVSVCGAGLPNARTAARTLPAGTYTVVIDAYSGYESGGFTLSVALGPPLSTAGDTCQSAVPLTFTGNTATVSGTTAGFSDHHDDACGSQAPDVFYTFTLTQPQFVDVRLNAPGWYAAVSLLSGCGAEVAVCDADITDVGTSLRTLPAGTYTVVIDGYVSTAQGPFTLTVTLGSPLSMAGDTCATAIPLTFTGDTATVSSNTAGYLDDIDTACGSEGRDVFYSFTLTQPQSVEVVGVPSGSWSFAVSLHSGCGSEVSVCAYDFMSARTSARTLPAGSYTIAVDGYVATHSGGFTLTVRLRPPLSTDGETCQAPIPLTFSNGAASVMGTTDGFLSNRDDVCGSRAPDVYYAFTLTQPQTVTLTVAPVGSWQPTLSLLNGCGTEAATCSAALQPRITRSLPAGSYTAVVDSAADLGRGSFTLSATLGPP